MFVSSYSLRFLLFYRLPFLLFLLPNAFSTAPFYSLISERIAERFSKACIKIIHERPMNLTSEEEVFHWVKFAAPRLYAVVTLAEEATTKRPSSFTCFRAMNILVADDGMKEAFVELTWKKRIDKSLWLIFLNSSIVDFFTPARMPFSLELIVISFQPSGSAIVYDVYRVSYDSPVRTKTIGFWSAVTGLILDSRSIYFRRSNLEQTLLRVGTIQNWPDGYYMAIWKEIEYGINATSVTLKPPDSATGSQQKDGSWTGMIGMTVRGEIDVIVSELTVNERRSQILDFSRPVLKSTYQIYFKQPGLLLDWSAVLKPFPIPLWNAIVIWVLGTSVSLAICYYVSLRLGIENAQAPYRFGNSFFFTLQTLAQQGREETPKSTACRILFFTSYLASSILYPCYSASLISSLTQKTPARPFDSIYEMLHDSTYKLLVSNSTAEHDYFAESRDELLSKAHSTLVKAVPPTNMIATSLSLICQDNHYALFGIQDVISRRILLDRRPTCTIITLSKPLSTVSIAMATAKNHPLHHLINFQLQKLIENGMLKRIFWRRWHIISQTYKEQWSQVEPAEVFQMFTILGFAILLSFLILIGEILHFHYRRPRVTKKRKRIPNDVPLVYPAYYN